VGLICTHNSIQIRGLSCHAVHSGKSIATDELAEYTGSKDRVYNYDRNGAFAAAVQKVAEKPKAEECSGATRPPVTAASVDEPTYSAKPKARDIAEPNVAIKEDDGIKVRYSNVLYHGWYIGAWGLSA
jgi:hypothetical protein